MLRGEMTPRLIAIAGSLKGTTFSLTQDEMSIGRELSNTVSINDPSVSRRHCLFKKNGASEEFSVEDLESYNGTFVNGVPVREQPLAHGDEIALGDIRFLFLTHEEAPSVSATFQDENLITRSTIRLEREHGFYLRPDRVAPELASSDTRATRERNALLTISTTINSTRASLDLQRRLLELTSEVIPAERAAILLTDEAGEEFVSIIGWNREGGADDSIRVSRTISRQVLTEIVALLSNDVFQNESIGGAPSLVESRVCSLLCVPLVAFDRPLGVIYFDTSSAISRFDEGHLQLLTAIAGIAAVALENAHKFCDLESENLRLQQEINFEHTMVGESQAMREVYTLLAKVAAASSTVLILGESGTGKRAGGACNSLEQSASSQAFRGD